MTNIILGISAFYHDSAAALLINGEIIAAAQEERFTRKKHDPGFPSNTVKYCLEEAGIDLCQIDAVAFYDKPLLKFERLLETYYAVTPKGLKSFISSMPVWMKEKMFLKKLIKDELKEIGELDLSKTKLLFPEHHLSHAASAFYPSPYKDAAILTIDGVGEWATASICHGEGEKITILKEQQFPHSLGLLYSAFTYFLGFRVNSGEYKLMGLAPYGDPTSEEVKNFVALIKEHLINIREDGSLWLNQEYFSYATGLRMVKDKKWEKIFGFPRREMEGELEPKHCNLGLAIQQITEELVISMAKEAKKLTGSNNLCMAGGVALNCVANGKLHDEKIFDNIFIQPAAGDAGGALGAALTAYHAYFEMPRVVTDKLDTLKGSYLGPAFTDKDIQKVLNKYQAVGNKANGEEAFFEEVCNYIKDGKVVGWFQGRMEFGPRALGARSILGDPRSAETQKKLNLKIKYRESFRPFAPSVLAEDVAEYFEHKDISPYMLMVKPVAQQRRVALPDNYHSMSIRDKLYTLRSDLPSITHIDFSGRIQTVHKETNPKFWNLINTFKGMTGYGVVVNTSFNVRGEPIVCTPEDAYRCFMRTEMDVLVVEDYIFVKEQQPEWKETDNWQLEFVLD